MTDTPPRQKHVDALKQFYKDAGVDLAKAKTEGETEETPQRHNLRACVPVAKLGAAKESYEKLLSTFEKSLDMKAGVKDPIDEDEWQDLYIDVNRGVVERDDFAGIVQHAGDLNLELSIDKSALIQKLKLDQTRHNCFFYLFEENLVSFLSAPVLELDGLLFPETSQQAGDPNQTLDKPVLIVLSEAEVHFAGEMLTIVDETTLAADPVLMTTLQGQQPRKAEQVGTSTIARVDQEKPKTVGDYVRLLLKLFSRKKIATQQQEGSPSAPVSATLQEEIQKYRTAASENPSLIGGQFAHLTPLHFLGHWEKENAALKRILAQHFVNICIFYTANRSTFDNEKNALISVYNSADRTTTLNLKDAPTTEISTIPLESLAKWLYGAKGTDRRTVFQNIIARELYNDDPKISYKDFITRGPQLLKDAVWQYQVFVDGKITKHFDELQKVIGYVADINKKISEAIDSVTKSLTDALLATVGVLVLTVLAALVKKDTSIEIFRLSMGIYSVYLVFYALYRMGSVGHSYRLLSKEASAQVSEYESALRVEEIANLSSSLRKRRRQFHIWFWLTVVLYLVLGASIWWAGKKGPQLLIERGIITAPGTKKPEASSSVFGKILHEQRFTC